MYKHQKPNKSLQNSSNQSNELFYQVCGQHQCLLDPLLGLRWPGSLLMPTDLYGQRLYSLGFIVVLRLLIYVN